jgi:outer membrane protein assembly factor BamB
MTDLENVRLSRRAVLAGAAGGAAALTLATSPLARANGWFPATAPWSLPGHDLAGSRSSSVRAGIGSERWRAHLPGGVTGAPLIWNRRVLAASFGGDVASFELETGRERWRDSFGTATYGTGADARELGFFGGIAVEADRIIVASDRARCLDARTGATIWETAPLRPAGGDDYFWAPPVIAGLTVILGSGAGSEATSTRGRVTAYSLLDGRLLWSTPMVPDGGNGGGVLSQPTVDLARRIVYVATGAPYAPTATNIPGTDSLVALDLHDGHVLWSDQVHAADQLGYDLNSAPVLIGPSLVAVAGKDGFHAWDRRSHRRLWNVATTPQSPAPGSPADPTTGPEGGPIASDGRRIYGLSNDSAAGSCVAAALDPWSGRVLWQTTLPAFSFSAPAVSRDVLAVPGSDGSLRLLAPSSGALLAELPLGEPSSGQVSLTARKVLVGTGAAPFLPGDSLVCFAS